MAYARPDMDGMVFSEHVLTVVPNPDRILPGYLYAFLSSKFGVPLVVGGTYGAIIQHIEPHHIADLRVPRLSEEIETRVHRLSTGSSRIKDTSFSADLCRICSNYSEAAGLPEPYQYDRIDRPSATWLLSLHGFKRSLRALNFDHSSIISRYARGSPRPMPGRSVPSW